MVPNKRVFLTVSIYLLSTSILAERKMPLVSQKNWTSSLKYFLINGVIFETGSKTTRKKQVLSLHIKMAEYKWV